jgi:hypothetical protein
LTKKFINIKIETHINIFKDIVHTINSFHELN